jgi:Flp pilus assembly protein protease CpaA
MCYHFIQISTLLFITLLVYFALVDIRIQHLENQQLLPSFIIGIGAIFNKLINFDPVDQILNFLFLFLALTVGFFLYISGFFGGADVKIIVILFMIIDPTKKYGITSSLDGIQFYFFYFSILLLFFLIRLLKNLIISVKIKFIKANNTKFGETLFLYTICNIRNLKRIKLGQEILLTINSAKINFSHSFTQTGAIHCWIRDHIPMIPFLTISTLLMIFT